MPNLYRKESSDPKANAQRNLCGRTHFVDDDTLRFHKSRVIDAMPLADGLLFGLVTSDALNCKGTRRGFRFAVFDLFGHVIARTEMADAFRRSEQASKALQAAVESLDAKAITLTAIAREASAHAIELARLRDHVESMP